MRPARVLLVAALLAAALSGLDSLRPHSRYLRRAPAPRLLRSSVRSDLISQCEEKWRDATLDHFSFANMKATFRQRYYVCSNYWKPDDDGNPGPIFFYLGNEADVLLYLNNTGLMWESAPDFGAMIVFAEHRYYGESLPFPAKGIRDNMEYLSAEQAMADYAELIWELKRDYNASTSAVIGFGGSYGGMLAAWFRMKYPHLLDGAVAGSAPIWAFMGEQPEVDPNFFAKGVTHDMSEAGGSDPRCLGNVRAGWAVLKDLGKIPEGRAKIRDAMQLCPGAALDGEGDVADLRNWLSGAWDFMAMGNFPYPSGYILNGNGQLPPFPVRVACSHLGMESPTDTELLEGMARAAGTFYNYTGRVECFNFQEGVNPETDQDGDFWDYQYCTEMFMPFGRDGETDAFWPEPWDPEAAVRGCRDGWGVEPRQLWATVEWGGRSIEAASNIVFSNGLLDPWHGAGVLRDVSDTLVTVIIPEGAHHLDLMFSNPEDPQSVVEARRQERSLIRLWVAQAKAQSAKAGSKGATRTSPHSSSSSSSSDSLWRVHELREGLRGDLVGTGAHRHGISSSSISRMRWEQPRKEEQWARRRSHRRLQAVA